jgi:hypothetical protein
LRNRFAVAVVALIVALGALVPVAASAKILSVEVVNDSDYCIYVDLSGRTSDLRTAANAKFSLQAHKRRVVEYTEPGTHFAISGAREQPPGCGGMIKNQKPRPEYFSYIDRTVYKYAWHATYTFHETSDRNWTLAHTP